MTDASGPADTITISVDDELLFRLSDGCRPLVYPDTVTRVSYSIGVNVLHYGTVWGLGYFDGVEALELDDGTVVALADIDARSVVLNATEAMRQAAERDPAE